MVGGIPLPARRASPIPIHIPPSLCLSLPPSLSPPDVPISQIATSAFPREHPRWTSTAEPLVLATPPAEPASPSVVLAITTFLLVGTPTLRAADVAENWTKHCGSCHGADGKAKTKAGRLAGAKDLTDAAYQKQYSDEQMLQRLKDGVTEKGKEKMKPFKGTLTDDELKALVKKVRAFVP